MWYVIHFKKDNTVDVVPSSWYKNGLCAWPIKNSNIKKIVQKKEPPNKKDFKWHIARKLGSCYDTYEQAKYKARIAQESSDLSGTENLKDRKIRAKIIDNSPSPEQKKMAIKSPPGIFLNKELVSDSESKDDSDLDPDFTLHIDSSPIRQFFSNDNNENVHIVYSPNEKSFLKTKTLSDSKLLKSQKKCLSYTQPTKASNSKDLFASFKTSEMETLSKSQRNIPSKRKLFDDFQEALELNDFSEKSCFEQQNPDDFSSALTLKKISSTASNQGLTLSNRKTSIEPTMSLAEFQKYVVNTLSTIKYDLNCCVSTNQQINANMNTLLENLSKNAVTSDDGFNDYDLNDVFPIESLEALQEFEFKLQRNENNFKTIMVRKLSLLVTNKSVGDSVRRVLSRMFDDKVLENYSTYGFKKKLRFSSLYSYQLLFDVLRTNIKYKTVPEKDIDSDIGTWLAHAHFRRVKKLNKTI
uniref:DUF4806 domain-containing protein n=1 Tax=Schizaphis graminum TaxID=13262 RepID=A0A2S2PM63_SCHGA